MNRYELREVLVGESPDGVRWVVLAGPDSGGGFYTSISRSLGDATAESGMGGEKLPPGQVINFWIGQADGTPLFVMARTAAPKAFALMAASNPTARLVSPKYSCHKVRLVASAMMEPASM